MSQTWLSPKISCGLGNRLFQFAASLGVAELLKRKPVFYVPAIENVHHGAIATLFRMYPHIPVIEEEAPCKKIMEPPNTFYKFIDLSGLKNEEGNIILDGSRQSPLYFPKDTRKLLPDWDSALGGPVVRRMLEKELDLTEKAGRRESSYAIHIRLGDYKYLPHHQIPVLHYYKQALNYIPPFAGTRLVLFSDEPTLCHDIFKEVLAGRSIELVVAPVHTDVESLYQMSLCLGGTITANSTFSWWGAWFAHENGAAWATYPDIWGTGLPPTTDLYPEWATVLRVS